MTDQLTHDSCNPHLSVVIEACAGSGKTWLLVSRIVRLLLSGAKPREILAITFTRKAAQEMRGRLDEVLLQLANCPESELIDELVARGLSGSDAKALVPRARVLFEEVLSDPYPLCIETFHGWFSHLLKGAPLNSGVPQGLKLRDDFKRLQDECLEDWWTSLPTRDKSPVRAAYELLVRELKAKNANDLLVGSKGFLTVKAEWLSYISECQKKGVDPLRAVIDQSNLLDIQDPLKTALDDPGNLGDLMSLASHLENGGKRDVGYSRAINDGLKKHSHQYDLTEVANALRPAFLTGDYVFLAQLSASTELKKSLKKLPNPGQLEQQINKTRQDWAQVLLDHYRWVADHRAHVIHQAWVTIGVDMLSHYQAKKELLRVQDFSDLEAYTAKLMLNSDVAHYLQARLDAKYKHLLIDEFQDTNPQQWQILLSWLNAYGEGEDKPSVFLVGDPKQSIYRFRRADVRLFNEAKTYLETHFNAEFHRFNATRRNSPAVLAAVNAVFQLPDVPEAYPFEEQTRNPQAKNAYGDGEVFCLPLIEAPTIAQHPNRNALINPYVDSTKESKAKQSYAEALQVALHIHKIKSEKNASWGDFLILLRSRTHLSSIEKAFRDSGIPCDSPRQGGLLKTLEAEDLVALLSVLITPTDDLSLAQVLRSPIYAFSDEQLMQLTLAKLSDQHHSYWQLMSNTENQYHHIYKDILSWVDLAKRLPVHDLLDHIYAQTDLRLRYAQSAPPLQKDQVLSNLDAFLALALDLDGGRYPSLPRFIAELKKIKRGAEEESPDEGESVVEEDSDDESTSSDARVRVLTIHAAKGLESRVVILMNTNTNRSGRDNVGVLMSWLPGDQGPIHMSPIFSSKPKDPARQELRDREEAIAEIENWNLLYVALTRAKEAVYISGLANKSDQPIAPNSWYDRLDRAGVKPINELNDVLVHKAKSISDAISSHEFFDFKVTWQGELSTLAPFDEELITPEQQKVIDLGVAFHAIMEHVMRMGIQNAQDLPSDAELVSWLNIDSSLVGDARQCAMNVLSSDFANDFFFSADIQNSWEELDIASSDGRLLRIDRLVELPNQLLILDYKLSIPDITHDLYQKYQLQMATYRQCVAKLRPDKEVKSYLLSGKGELLEMNGPH
ncbi:MAG: UvrD-helicase domain-containing protein [Polynucleobacter sp.]